MRSTWFQGDDAPRPPSFRLRPPRTAVGFLIVANAALFMIQSILGGSRAGATVAAYLMLWCDKLLGPTFFLYLYQLVTYQFLHGGFFHIFFNMLFLWFFGRELEAHLGSRRFLFLYLASGVTGGLAFVVFSAFQGIGVPVAGASGAVFGIVAYYALTWPGRTVNVFPFLIPMKAIHMAALYVGIELFQGFFASGDGVAHVCHLGGALFGYLFFRYERTVRTTLSRARERKQTREEGGEAVHQAEVDRLLAKIHDHGLGSLTQAERDFLNDASRRIRRRH